MILNIIITICETLFALIIGVITGAYCEHKWMIEHGYCKSKDKYE